MSKSEATFAKLATYCRETAAWQGVDALLNWDERTYLPPSAGEFRADQIGLVAKLIHERSTSPQLGEWLSELGDSDLADDVHSVTGCAIHHLQREFDKQTKLPGTLVEAITRAEVLGQQSWVEARKNNDYPSFQPKLEQILKLKLERAQLLSTGQHLYDVMLDDYEPAGTVATIEPVLAALRNELTELLQSIAASEKKSPYEIVTQSYPVDQQAKFGIQAAKQIGFDFDRGRLDITHHPFCTGMGPNDTRITTRYDEHHFPGAFFGTLHEAGHGIYDQGLPTEHYGLPPGEYVSLGIHESQSRMWENMVGRSHSFWEYFYSDAQKNFPTALGDVSLDQFYFAINDVRPSLIRVEADEATYNLHIIIRFELEQALVSGDLPLADLPSAWNEKYQTYLGIQPPTNADGVLQDVHWSAGLLGYFPTYALGNLYAAQFYAQAEADLGDLSAQFRKGEFVPLKNWLTENIHGHGKRYTAAELVQNITGQPLSHEPLMKYLRTKYGDLYL